MREFALLAIGLFAATGLGCTRNSSPLPAAEGLADESLARGLSVNVSRGGSDYFMPDSMGPGCALFDADGDGDLDAFLVQAVRGPAGELESEAGRDRLYLQQPDGHFRDASAGSGLDDPRYGMGAAIADVDGDGDMDVFVTNFGSSRLFLGSGDGTFVDATEDSGVREDQWAATAGFFDYDADGQPDLFVARYLALDPSTRGKGASGGSDYPSPLQFPGLPAGLWHNDGAGRFRDVSKESGIASLNGRGLGLAFDDLDGDGRIDVFVANDSEPNFAWLQTSPGRFQNKAFELGVAVNRLGRPQANMGVALGDADGDGQLDLFVTHLVTETNILYRRSARAKFVDATEGSGLGTPSLDLTGFGTHFADVENDGDLDLLVLNGRVLRRLPRAPSSVSPHWAPYAEENQLFLGQGNGAFVLANAATGGDFSASVVVGRALAVADVDRDGGLDVLVHNGDGSCRLYMNRFPARGHWLSLRVLDAQGRRDALGARVELIAGGRRWLRPVTTCQGYLSAADSLVHFGLGTVTSVDEIVVHWPDGSLWTSPSEAAGATRHDSLLVFPAKVLRVKQ